MKILKPGLLVVVAALVMIGCSSAPPVNDMPDRKDATNPQTPMDLPDWYINNTAEDDVYYYSVGTAESQTMARAIDKAKEAAKVELSERVEANVQSMVKNFVQEAGMSEDTQIMEFYQSTSKTVTNNTFSGITVLKRYPYQKSNDRWIAYVQMALKKDAVSKTVVNLIQNEEAMYAEFKASQAFKDLEASTGGTE